MHDRNGRDNDDGDDDRSDVIIDRTGFLGGLTPISEQEEDSLIGNWED